MERGSWTDSAIHFFGGGLSGVVAKSCVAPLDRVKILFQTLSRSYPNMSPFRTLRAIYVQEGCRGLWRGNLSHVVRIYPYAAVQYASFEQYKRFLCTDSGRPHFVGALFLAGCTAGATAVCLTYPLDVVRGRLAVENPGSSGIFDVLGKLRREGKMFAGIRPSLLGIVPFAGTKFLIFEEQKIAWSAMTEKPQGEIPAAVRLGMGAFAGVMGQTVSFPLDVVRRRMQVAGLPSVNILMSEYSEGTFRILSLILQREGLRGWYRGILLDYMKVAPMVAISLSVFDYIKSFAYQIFAVKLDRRGE